MPAISPTKTTIGRQPVWSKSALWLRKLVSPLNHRDRRVQVGIVGKFFLTPPQIRCHMNIHFHLTYAFSYISPNCTTITIVVSLSIDHHPSVAAGRGAYAPGGTLQGTAFGGSKYGNLKFGRFWRIGVCIADSDILHLPYIPPSFGTTPPTISAPQPHTKQCVHQETHC